MLGLGHGVVGALRVTSGTTSLERSSGWWSRPARNTSARSHSLPIPFVAASRR